MKIKLLWEKLIYFFAFGLGLGLIPFAPGTWGTVVGAGLYFFCLKNLALPVYLVLVFFAFLIGIYICGYTARAFYVHDHPSIVWDEIVGYWITMTFAPPGLLWVVLGFILFRLFDIAKPWPINWLDQKVKGGVGIMLDDVVAGIFAAIGLSVIHVFI